MSVTAEEAGGYSAHEEEMKEYFVKRFGAADGKDRFVRRSRVRCRLRTYAAEAGKKGEAL